ncbi:MAG TPA: hypothetical protein ENO10_02295 [Salinimicrobium catena]|uniref:Two-component sensor histidine kinase n=1 Tax=Salinimicrobium catena TaxID=390640 RepID=A0A7C2R392_9FLAO|nr:hypothetical protein [Salinimicrobium catena]
MPWTDTGFAFQVDNDFNCPMGAEGIIDSPMNKFIYQIGFFISACLLVLFFPLYSIFWIYPHFTEIVTFEKEVNAKQIATHITKMLVMDSSPETLKKENITENFVEVLKEARSDFDLTKIKIFSSRGEVLYSTDAQEIGNMNTHSYFTDRVSKGKIFSNVVHRDKKTMEGKTVKKDVVETYVPLMRNEYFVGALEIYYDITYTEHSINNFVAKSLIITLMVSLSLLLCILFISLATITYYKKLLKARREVQLLKDRMPPLYNLSADEPDERLP